jgi:hypothetical protein
VISALSVRLELFEPEFLQCRQVFLQLLWRLLGRIQLIDYFEGKLFSAKLVVVLLQIAVPVRSELQLRLLAIEDPAHIHPFAQEHLAVDRIANLKDAGRRRIVFIGAFEIGYGSVRHRDELLAEEVGFEPTRGLPP